MKNFKLVLLATVVTLCSFTAKAQNEDDVNTPVKPRWSTEKGYWVVETTLQNPKNAVVHIYSNTNQLIYSENVTGVALDTRKTRILMKLKRATEKAVRVWETNPTITRADGQLNLFADKKTNS